MKRYIYQSLFCASLVLFLASCSAGLHRGIPRGERHQRTEQVVVNLPEKQTLAKSEESQPSEETSIREIEAETTTASVAADPIEPAVVSDRTEEPARVTETPVSPPDGDTLVLTQDQLDEAIDSERVAKNAQIFSWLPIAGIILFPLWLVGVIGTVVCINKLNKYEYVTEEALRRKRLAMITVVITSILAILIPVGFILLLIFLL